MKKVAFIVTVLVFLLALPGQARGVDPDAAFIVGYSNYFANGSGHDMDAAPFIKDGRVYVPVRYLAYALGMTDENIAWFAPLQTVTFHYRGKDVSVGIGKNIILINTTVIEMDVTPVIRAGRVFLPARYIVEAFGGTIEWLPKSQSILIFPNDEQESVAPIVDYDYLDFSWTYRGTPYYFQTDITGEMASKYLTTARKVPHPCLKPQDLLFYCSDEDEREFLSTIVDRFKETLLGMSNQEIAKNVIAFVQGLEYTSDGNLEYPRFPTETLFEKTGDCEDMAILTASMLRELNYDVALIVFADHVGVGIAGEEGLPGYYFKGNGVKYYYLETTTQGWNVGDLMDDDKYMRAIVLPLP